MSADKTILIVEDSATNRKVLKHILVAHHFQTLEAANGQIALDMMLSGQYEISLVLLDLTMPVMNGYELLDEMQKNNLLTSIPVIVTTGSEGENTEVLCLKKGAVDFLTKPYNDEIVCHRIESIFRLIENTALVNKLEIDQLTEIYNREAFYRHAKKMIDEHPDQNYDIVCSNIENFKVINSKLGIHTGDELLKCIADHNKRCVGNEGVCGRIGADTFVVLRKSNALRTQEEIAKRFSDAYADAPVKKFIMQYGVYQITDRTKSISAMCDCALLALASVKHKYGVYYGVYDKTMRQKIMREHQLTEYMEQALTEKQFVVYLQPKHNVVTGEISGAEALVRWIHPEIGFISPGEFIPLFERNGFITNLDRYIWEEVCIVIKRWIDEGRKPIPVSVNASRVDFSLDNLPEIIVNLVDSYDIPHHILHFEVTESAYTDNPKQIISTVSLLRSMGFLIEMDDFGSGYSSLNMLSELPIDILKLDMRFMQKNDNTSLDNKRSILSFTVSLSKWMQLPTIAEGVETAEEVELLKAMGCNYIQGYIYARPMPVSEFETYMEKNAKKNNVEPQEKPSELKQQVLLENAPKVLIVEDIESNRELLIELLKPYYRLTAVENGKEALEYITEHHSELSCVLLDLLMPVMDGFQVLEHMKHTALLDELPVIITSESGTDSELRALRLGGDSFISKPYISEILLHHVEKAVHEHEYRRLQDK